MIPFLKENGFNIDEITSNQIVFRHEVKSNLIIIITFGNKGQICTTVEELVGALEEQAEILEKRGFDWLLGNVDYNLDEILITEAEKRAKDFSSIH